ncbi:MAG: Gfo/Idh/MocA family oxidoreductase [Spirochaetales bacterium]|nr:Gfo/Idh/MocA family oxidoreductase [Spirochaetales bacterium]
MKNVALIGCGRISNRHIEAIEAHPNLRVAVACDVQMDRAQAVAQRTGARPTTDMLDITEADIVSILTPSGMHPRHAIAVAEGTHVPNIVVEKPIALTVRESLELFHRVEGAGKRLLPVYQNRYNPLVAYIRDLVKSGALGRVHHFICDVLWNRNDAYFAIDWHGTRDLDGGVLYTQASHYVDMLHFLFGEIDEYSGVGGNLRQLEVHDSVAAAMKFKNGTVGTLNATVDAFGGNLATELTLIAEKGNIRLSGTNLNEIVLWNVEGMEKPHLDFKLDHQYGKGHNTLYEHIVNENWDAFPSKEDVFSGIRLMERLSY